MITIKKEYFLTSTNFSSNVFKMISRDFQSMLWVSNMILMTRVTQRNKLWVRATLQSVFTDGNESSCWFFQFDALSKSKFWVLHNMLLTLKITTHLWKIAQIQRKMSKTLRKCLYRLQRPKVDLRMKYYGLKRYGLQKKFNHTEGRLECRKSGDICLA